MRVLIHPGGCIVRLTIMAVLVVGISALLAPANARADASGKTLTVEDVFNLQLATDPQISPDGKRIIYVRRFSDIMTDQRHSNLWIVNTDGTDHRPLTSGNFNDASPRWSHDGSQIIYISNRDGGPQIYRRWMDSGQTAKLTNLTAEPAGIAWSPDDQWISFTMFVPEKAPDLVQMPTAPEGAKWAEPAKVIDRLIYRFNGAGYLKAGYTHLFVVPAEGGTPRQISEGKFHHGGLAFQSSEAVWTPDGKYLLMSANRHPDFESDPLNTEVYEFAVADGSVKALTKRKGPDNNPEVSPDGKKIAYVGFDDRYQGYQLRQLYVMNRDGSNSELISGAFDNDVQSPRWAPDGNGIYFTSAVHGNTGLYFIDLEGHLQKLAGDVGSATSASGGAPTFSVAKTGTFALTRTRPDLPGEIAVGAKAAPAPKVLTKVNEGLLSGRTLGHVEEIWYESSKDHRKIQGWIFKPPGFDPAKKYPLILEIHGGPFANYGDRFDLEKQLMAARGYVVLYTNPRGSTSYGAEFGNLIHHAYPGDDFADLNSGVDAVARQGLYRSGTVICHRRQRRWRAHVLGHRPHNSVPRGGHRLPRHQLVQLRAHLRHRRLDLQVLVPGPSLGQRRSLRATVAPFCRQECQNANDGSNR